MSLETTFLPKRRAQRYVDFYINFGKLAADKWLHTEVPKLEHYEVTKYLSWAFKEKGWTYHPPSD